MTSPRTTRTNASDSAPGVDDGPAGVRAPPVDSKPSGRGKVWIAIVVVALIAIVAFFTHPPNLGVVGASGGPHQVAQINPAAPGGAPSQQQPSQQ